MKTLLLGGSGRLGIELQKYFYCVAPPSENLDITQLKEPLGDYDIVINSAAYTDVVSAEKEREKCFNINVVGTYNLVKAYSNAKFVFISSEYAFNPQNFYSWTKLWGEEIVRRFASSYLIIRTSFVSRPFSHKYAFFDQFTRSDYVDVIAPMIVAEILRDSVGVKYIGTRRKTMFELARQTKPSIKGISVDDIKSVKLPKDYE
jgi:dTDP-4-dehydrorhamnose reductase